MTLATLEVEKLLPASLTLPGLDEHAFLELSEKFPDCTLEYTADGEVLVMPPTDPITSHRVAGIIYQLAHWVRQTGRGIYTGSDGGFFLPDGSRRSPDAAWFDSIRWDKAMTPGSRFPMFAPDFVIEVRSPGQRSRPLREKMEDYILNGVVLAWLVDPIEKSVAIYRAGGAVEVLSNPKQVTGEGPVHGFVLDTAAVFK
jgi:Uma2 family endonuclease